MMVKGKRILCCIKLCRDNCYITENRTVNHIEVIDIYTSSNLVRNIEVKNAILLCLGTVKAFLGFC